MKFRLLSIPLFGPAALRTCLRQRRFDIAACTSRIEDACDDTVAERQQNAECRQMEAYEIFHSPEWVARRPRRCQGTECRLDIDREPGRLLVPHVLPQYAMGDAIELDCGKMPQ
jgi:hypothetical protein